MRLLILLLLAPALVAQPVRISDEVPAAVPEARAATFDQSLPRIASNGSGFFAVWNSGFDVEGTRITADGVVLDRPALHLGETWDYAKQLVSNGDTYLLVTLDVAAVKLTELSPAGAMVRQRAIPDTRVRGIDVAWNGSHYLLGWISGQEVMAMLLTRDLKTMWTISLGEADSLALSSNGSVFLAVKGSSTRAVVEASIVSPGGVVSAPVMLQAGTSQINNVTAERHGASFLVAFSAAVEEVVLLDGSGAVMARRRLEGTSYAAAVPAGDRIVAASDQWLYDLDASLNVIGREPNRFGAISAATVGSHTIIAGTKEGFGDTNIEGRVWPGGPDFLISYSYWRRVVRQAVWTGDTLTLMWEHGSAPVISRLTAGGVPLDGPGFEMKVESYPNDPFYERWSALAWNGSRYAVAYRHTGTWCCINELSVLDAELGTIATEPFKMRSGLGKVTASDGRHFLFADRAGTALVDAEGKVLNTSSHLFEYENPPRRALWAGSEYLVLQANGAVDRVARDGAVVASSDETPMRDFATDGRELVGVWRDGQQILAARFRADATMLGAAVPVSAATERTIPFVVWDGVTFVVAAVSEDVTAGNLVVRRLYIRGGALQAGATATTALPPHVVATTFVGGPGRSALVYTRSGERYDLQRLQSYVRFVTGIKRRAVR